MVGLGVVVGIAFGLFGGVEGGAAEAPPPLPWAQKLESLLKTPGFEDGRWGILVAELDSGKVLYSKNARELFSPASVTKLFSGASALVDLGPDFRFVTPVHRRGEVNAKGILDGDLILVASGDPNLGGRAAPNGQLLYENIDHSYADDYLVTSLVSADPLAGLEHLARQVADAGIKQINGDILVDDRLYASGRSSGSGPRVLSPIMVNDNLVDLKITPAAMPGQLATVTKVPDTAFLTIDARVTTGPAEGRPSIEVTRLDSRRYKVRGAVPMGHPSVVRACPIEEPAAFARTLFMERLRAREITLEASPIGHPESSLPPEDEIANLPKVAELTSAPFREALKVILKVSQNLHASSLPPLLGQRHGTPTISGGLRREGEILGALGVGPAGISFGGGAGGERADLASPEATVALLRAMATRKDFSAFHDALPILGRDGTLAKVGVEGAARGRVFAKTGTFTETNSLRPEALLISKALAGYLETAGGRKLAFAIFVNNVPLPDQASEGRLSTVAAGQLLGAICEAIAGMDPPAEPKAPAEE